MNKASKAKITLFMSFSGEGGVERMITNLAREFVRLGHPVEMVLIKARGEHLKRLPQGVTITRLGTRHSLLSLWPLIRYLKQHRPESLLVAKHRAIIVALLASKIANSGTRIVGRLGTNLSQALEGKSRLRQWFWHVQMRKLYPLAAKIVPVSEGVAQDVANITGLTPDKLEVIRNPVITPEMPILANEPIDHPWLASQDSPVILGAGRFTRQKDFITLIKAFALARKEIDCRLIILGAGQLAEEYRRLAKQLEIEEAISLPGFKQNPYPYMKQASLFVLSSAWEGSPNVLSEALALGTPVVSTDCPSGPREVLQNGRIGPLVPVGNVERLAEAIVKTLKAPPPESLLKSAVEEYNVAKSAQHYLSVLGIA